MHKEILTSRQKSKNKPRLCMFNNCKHKAIKSHVLQKNGILREISNNNHLIQLLPPNPFQMEEKGIFDFKSIGVNNVYTFSGFCQKHDTEIFKPIESNLNLDFNNKYQQTLFSYRGLCQEIRRKEISIEWIEDLKDFCPPYKLPLIDSLTQGFRDGLKNLGFFKTELEKAIISDNYSSFQFTTIEIPKIELCISVALNIDTSNSNLNIPFSTSFLNVFPKNDKSYIIAGYHKNYPCEWTDKFIEKLQNNSKKEINKELSDLITLRLEFWTMSPLLFNQINEKDIIEYKKLFSEHIFDHSSELTTKLNLFRNI